MGLVAGLNQLRRDSHSISDVANTALQ
ncbi:hypothetical protein HDF14_005049 [Edaphobacter lichenicola]|uniref:Uncharacterized protein n=1 Tax=Tunturiibacter gelidiferens TaxID=3069689 RepID=A0A9X0U7V7_9BACT|nr:hypothetical protein [Edaphobacter lichenicola]